MLLAVRSGDGGRECATSGCRGSSERSCWAASVRCSRRSGWRHSILQSASAGGMAPPTRPLQDLHSWPVECGGGSGAGLPDCGARHGHGSVAGQTVPGQLQQPTQRPTTRWMVQCFPGDQPGPVSRAPWASLPGDRWPGRLGATGWVCWLSVVRGLRLWGPPAGSPQGESGRSAVGATGERMLAIVRWFPRWSQSHGTGWPGGH